MTGTATLGSADLQSADNGWALQTSRFIAAPPAKVWDAMKNRQAEYFCPRPWRFEPIEQDWRAGGRSHSVMHGPDGERNEGDGLFLEVTEGVRFVFTDAFRVGWVPTGEPFMVGCFAIAPEGNGTRVTGTARHWSEEAMRRHADMGFQDGWGVVFDQLAELVE